MLQAERGDLGALIRAKVLAGTLPKDAPRKVWAGYGSGKVCSACDLPAMIKDVEYEVEMEDHHTFLFHQPCLALWDQERARYLEP
jgi:hypothetical protein